MIGVKGRKGKESQDDERGNSEQHEPRSPKREKKFGNLSIEAEGQGKYSRWGSPTASDQA